MNYRGKENNYDVICNETCLSSRSYFQTMQQHQNAALSQQGIVNDLTLR